MSCCEEKAVPLAHFVLKGQCKPPMASSGALRRSERKRQRPSEDQPGQEAAGIVAKRCRQSVSVKRRQGRNKGQGAKNLECKATEEANGQRMTFSELPPEMIIKIFSYLNEEELITSVALVCKKWETLAKDPSLWKHVVLDGLTLTLTYSQVAKWLRCMRWLKKLHLMEWNSVHAGTMLKAVAKTAPKLEVIHLTGFYKCMKTASLEWFFQKCTELKEVEVSDVILTKGGPHILDLLSEQSKMWKLTLGPGVWPFSSDRKRRPLVEKKWDELVEVIINCIVGGYEFKVVTSSVGHQLKKLEVSSYSITHKSFKHLSRCMLLEELHLKNALWMSDRDLTIVAKLRNLQHLTIMYGMRISEDAIQNFLSLRHVVGKLVSLDLTGSQITDQGLSAIASNCPNLKHLILGYCFKVTLQGLMTFTAGHKGLTHLSIFACGQLGDMTSFVLNVRPTLRIIGFY